MAGKFYIKHEGRKIYRETAAAITKLARELADATGIGVPVYTEVVGVGSRAGSVHREAPFVRNPVRLDIGDRVRTISGETGRVVRFTDGGNTVWFENKWGQQTVSRHLVKRTGGPLKMRRNPVGMEGAEHMLRMSGERQRRDAHMARRMGDDYFPPAKDTPASRAGRYIVRATKAGKVNTVKVSTLEKAREVAQAFAENGYRAVVDTGNPSPTKASKARRTASNKRGAFVEYTEGGVKKRIKYGNKGIATIRAAAMKRDGWRGVRVVSA